MKTSRRSRPPISEFIDSSAYSFVVVDLRFRNEADIPGLIRNELEPMLPHGIDGTAFFFQRVGPLKRFVVTLIKKPLPDDFSPEKTALPFPLAINERNTCTRECRVGGLLCKVEYEGGYLKSILPCRYAADIENTSKHESNPNPDGHPAIQLMVGGEKRIWKIAATILAIALVLQLSLLGIKVIALRTSRLAILEEYLGRIDASNAASIAARNNQHNEGYQDRAVKLAELVSSAWKGGYFITMLTLKDDKLQIEGWGPNAIYLLSSLKTVPELRALSLRSNKSQKGTDFFAFEGNIKND